MNALRAFFTQRQFLFVAGFIATALVLLAALLGELMPGMDACPLCIGQRYLYLLFALCAFIAFALPQQMLVLGSLLRWAALLTLLLGAGVALYQSWILAFPTATGCGADPLEAFFNDLWLAQKLPFLFEVRGFCSAPTPPILGLSIVYWSALWMLALLAMMTAHLRLRGRLLREAQGDFR
jgi:disulfide bond formation protein DsbB